MYCPVAFAASPYFRIRSSASEGRPKPAPLPARAATRGASASGAGAGDGSMPAIRARALSRRERRKRRPGTVSERANVLTRLGGVMRETTTRADAPVRDEWRARRRARPGRTNEHPLPHFRRARDFVLEPVPTHPPTADGNENHAMHSRDCFFVNQKRRAARAPFASGEGTLRVGHRGYPTSARAVRRATSSTVTIWYTFRTLFAQSRSSANVSPPSVVVGHVELGGGGGGPISRARRRFRRRRRRRVRKTARRRFRRRWRRRQRRLGRRALGSSSSRPVVASRSPPLASRVLRRLSLFPRLSSPKRLRRSLPLASNLSERLPTPLDLLEHLIHAERVLLRLSVPVERRPRREASVFSRRLSF